MFLSFRVAALAGAVLSFGLGAAIGAPANAQETTDYTVLQERDDRKIVKLANGMIAVAQELPTAPVVSAQIWVKTGSIYEQEFVGTGISHYLEHLLAGGTTTRRSEAESNAILGQIGAQRNAATGLDNVRYFIHTTSEHTETVVDLVSDWVRNAVLEPAEVEREMEVVQQEFSFGEGDPNRIFWHLTQQARYTAHPARHPIIGYIDEFREITRDDLVEFYQRMYPPNNLLMVVVGDIDSGAVIDQIAGLWGDAEPRELPELQFPVEPELDQPRELTGHADISRPRVRLAWPGTRLGEEHDYALDVLGMILGQGETSRLVRSVRDELRMVNSAVSYNQSWDWGEGFFGIDAEIADFTVDVGGDEEGPESRMQRQIDGAVLAILEQVQLLREDGISEEELARAKRQVMAGVVSADQTAQGMAGRLARDIIATGDPDYLQFYADAVQELTVEDIQRAAETFLEAQRMITVRLLPLAPGQRLEPLARPDEPDLEQFALEDVQLDNERLAERMEELLVQREVESRPLQVDGLVAFELDNGMRLLVQRSTVVPAVSMELYWRGGLLGERAGEEGVANAVAQMLMRGTERRSAQALAEILEGLGAGMSTQAGSNTNFAAASSLREDWPQVMELMREVLLEPAFPEDEWERLQPRLLASIARELDDWQGELDRNFRRVYYGEHPWARSPRGRAETVERLTVEDLEEYHRGQLGGNELVMAVVGDVDPDEVHAKVRELFGDLPAAPERPFEPAPEVIPASSLEQVVTLKQVAAVQIGFGPIVDVAHEDYPAMRVLARLMGQSPAGWLSQALRGEGPGLVYATGAGLSTGLIPGHFLILFNTSPELLPEALQRAMAVADRARRDEIAETDLERARADVLAGEFLGRQSNSQRAQRAALDELYGVLDPDGEEFLAAVQAVDAQVIRRVAEQYLVNPVVTVLTHQPVDEEPLHAIVASYTGNGERTGALER